MPRARALWVILLLVSCAVGAAQRLAGVTEIVERPDGSVHLLGSDPYFHLRHTRFVIEHFPAVQRIDVATHYPRGTHSVAGLFDVGLAAAAMVLHGADLKEVQLLHLLAWAPVVIALLSMVMLALTVRRLTDPWLGLVAVVFFLLFPGEHLERSLYGFADHHVLEVLLWIASTYGVVRCLQLEQAAPGARGFTPDLLSVAPLCAFLFSWHGAPLHVASICVTLAVLAGLAALRDAEQSWLVPALVRYGLSAVLLAVPLALVWPWLVIEVTVFWAAVGALVALAALVAPVPWLLRGRSRRVRVLALAAIGFCAAGALLSARAASPLLRELLGTLVAKGGDVSEHLAIGLGGQLEAHGALLPFCALGLPWLLVRVLRGPRAGWITAWAALHCGVFYVLSALSYDYRYGVAAALSLLACLVLDGALRLGSRRSLIAVCAGGALVTVAPIWPLDWVKAPLRSHAELEKLRLVNDGWLQAGAWIARETPPPPLPIDTQLPADTPRPVYWARVAETYGIASTWDDGHIVAALGRRTVLQSGYPSQELARLWLVEDEDVAYARLREWGPDVRYVVSEPRTVAQRFSFKVQQAGLNPARYLAHADITDDGVTYRATTFDSDHDATLVSRLYQQSGLTLSRFRLVYETPHESVVQYYTERPDGPGNWGVEGVTIPVDGPAVRERYAPLVGKAERFREGYALATWIEPTVKLFETVEGAVVRGRVRPGARVALALELDSRAAARRRQYLRTGVADAAGFFAIRVAHGSRDDTARGSHPSDVIARGAYSIYDQQGDGLRSLGHFHLPQSLVHSGGELDLGLLAAPAEAGAR